MPLKDEALKTCLADVTSKYERDFPPEVPSQDQHKSTIEQLEVIHTAMLSDRGEYEQELANYLKSLERHEEAQIKEYIMARVAFLVADLDNELPSKINKFTLARENKRKLVMYNIENDGGVNWEQVKSRRLNCFGGCGPGASKSRF